MGCPAEDCVMKCDASWAVYGTGTVTVYCQYTVPVPRARCHHVHSFHSMQLRSHLDICKAEELLMHPEAGSLYKDQHSMASRWCSDLPR